MDSAVLDAAEREPTVFVLGFVLNVRDAAKAADAAATTEDVTDCGWRVTLAAVGGYGTTDMAGILVFMRPDTNAVAVEEDEEDEDRIATGNSDTGTGATAVICSASAGVPRSMKLVTEEGTDGAICRAGVNGTAATGAKVLPARSLPEPGIILSY